MMMHILSEDNPQKLKGAAAGKKCETLTEVNWRRTEPPDG